MCARTTWRKPWPHSGGTEWRWPRYSTRTTWTTTKTAWPARLSSWSCSTETEFRWGHGAVLWRRAMLPLDRQLSVVQPTVVHHFSLSNISQCISLIIVVICTVCSEASSTLQLWLFCYLTAFIIKVLTRYIQYIYWHFLSKRKTEAITFTMSDILPLQCHIFYHYNVTSFTTTMSRLLPLQCHAFYHDNVTFFTTTSNINYSVIS